MPGLKLYTCMTDGEPTDFNARHDLTAGEAISPRNAFMRTFPWSVHGFCLYKANHMKRFALTEISDVDNFNADEFLTRRLLLYASKIVGSTGTYHYGINDESITRNFSTKTLGALKVNDLLFKLALKEGFEGADLQKTANHCFWILVSLKLQVIEKREDLTEDEVTDAHKRLNQAYSWASSVNFRSPRMLRAKIVSHLPEFLIKRLLIGENEWRASCVSEGE